MSTVLVVVFVLMGPLRWLGGDIDDRGSGGVGGEQWWCS